jgi:hypothetical protein
VIFGENGTAVIIDFDYSGRVGEKKYPAGFAHDIDDGKRHKDAMAGVPYSPNHDWFAVGGIMERCQCETDLWEEALREAAA